MERLAESGVTFMNSYCNSPLCLPSRMSFMTVSPPPDPARGPTEGVRRWQGRYGSRVESYDNASPLASDAVTWAHRFGAAGYDVALAGKQHFCGLDQLHGFHAQLSRDIHAELWMEDGPAFVPKGHADWSVPIDEGRSGANWHIAEQAGPGITEEIEVDDDVEAKCIQFMADPARREAPWALNAGFIAPHFPLVCPEEYWEMYPHDQIDLPPQQRIEDQPRTIQRMRRECSNGRGLGCDAAAT